MKKIAILAALFFALISTRAFAEEYTIDPSHSTISFKIRHLFSKVQGQFTKYDASFSYDEKNPEAWKAQATIQADSINTGVEDRDKHLKSADFFDVEKYPTIEFKSTGISGVSDGKAKLNGILTMHGVEQPITLDLEIRGVGKDPWGKTRFGGTATTNLNRKDFGLTWNKAVETGQMLVGEEVEITLEIEGVLQNSAEAPAAETAQ